jgi:hypothetical protein
LETRCLSLFLLDHRANYGSVRPMSEEAWDHMIRYLDYIKPSKVKSTEESQDEGDSKA